MNHVLAGFLSGLAATVPMSAVMEAGHAKLPLHRRYSLPPPRIEERARRKVGLSRGGRTADHRALAIVLHFAFGGSAGAVYGGVADRLPGPVLAKSVVFGVGVWAASYLLGLPALLGLERHAVHEPAQRNALMIGAHVVWGAALGATFELLRADAGRSSRRKRRRAEESSPRRAAGDRESEPVAPTF